MASNFSERDMGWNKLMTTLKVEEGESAVFVGYLRSSGVHKPKDKGKPMSMAQLAAVHEFGSPSRKIPERSFMRSAVSGNKDKITRLLKKLTGQILEGKLGKKQALGTLGQFVSDLMRRRIQAGVPPPNKPATVEAKGSSKTLVDTGQLMGAIDWEVRSGKGNG